MLLELVTHFVDERRVGEQDAAAERVAEQLAAELLQKRITARGKQVAAQAVESVDFRTVHDLRLYVDGVPAQIFFAETADGIVGFERVAIRVDAAMTAVTLGIGRVFLGELADGE